MISLIPIVDFYVMHTVTILAFIVIGVYIVLMLRRSHKKTSGILKRGNIATMSESYTATDESILVTLEKVIHVGDAISSRAVYECDGYQVWETSMKKNAFMPPHKHVANHEVFVPIMGCFVITTYDPDHTVHAKTFVCRCGECAVDATLVNCNVNHAISANTDCTFLTIAVPPLEFDNIREVGK